MIAAVLAGGRGRRLGEPKALADLGGAPLIARALAAAAAFDTVVVAKRGTPLPGGLTVWHEPDEPVHPLTGVVCALERADGPVVAVPCDMPFVTAELLERVAAVGAVRVDGRLQPFPARFEPAWLPALRDALEREAGVRATLEALGPDTVEWEGDELRSVNTPAELAAAREVLG